MNIPGFWAEFKIIARKGKTRKTIKRFGWSDESLEKALENARERAEDAMRRWESGENIIGREYKTAYNGDNGLPIREEILHKDHDCVITRNSYGAHCLNTENVFFADLDYPVEQTLVSSKMKFGLFIHL